MKPFYWLARSSVGLGARLLFGFQVENRERILIFPEGARTLDGQIQPAQPGVGFLVAKTRAPVIPMRIFGARAALPRGSARLRPTRVRLVIGNPLQFSLDRENAQREGYRQIGEQIMQAICEIEPDRQNTQTNLSFEVACCTGLRQDTSADGRTSPSSRTDR